MECSLIACSSTSCLIGFDKYAVHPAARHISRSPFKAEAVSAMIGVGGRWFGGSPVPTLESPASRSSHP